MGTKKLVTDSKLKWLIGMSLRGETLYDKEPFSAAIASDVTLHALSTPGYSPTNRLVSCASTGEGIPA
eukprot:2649080-Pleurochrysis_carterae.AAC.1